MIVFADINALRVAQLGDEDFGGMGEAFDDAALLDVLQPITLNVRCVLEGSACFLF